jgi:aconitate hydratase
MFKFESYANVFAGDARWQPASRSPKRTYGWDDSSTYVKNPPYFVGMPRMGLRQISDIKGARALACSAIRSPPITSRRPATSRRTSPAGKYLTEQWRAAGRLQFLRLAPRQPRVMMRGTFANIRLKNQHGAGHRRRRTPSTSRAASRCPSTTPRCVPGRRCAAGDRRQGIRHRLLARLGGQGHLLLGVKRVIAESFERIHRSNLVGMGVLPLTFKDGQNARVAGPHGQRSVRRSKASRAGARN